MNVLVLNCGSSSIKYQLFDMPGGDVLARGTVDRIGRPGASARQTTARGELALGETVPDHHAGLGLVMRMLTDGRYGALNSVGQIDACGHRVVHGGERFTGSVAIDDEVERVVEACGDLAPLHNPPNLAGIREARAALGNAPQVACFDTAFHQTIPMRAYLYGLPYELYERHRIRRYGFHGASHRYVAGRAAEMLGRPAGELNLITCHLGNGCSITAVQKGRSVDTSMGFTPLEGVLMGTRSGSFDPAILLHLARKGYTTEEMDRIANLESGLLGVSGVSNDMRDIERAAAAGHVRAALAIDMFAYSVRKHIGAYLAVLGGCDAIVFTGGVGEHADDVRRMILEGLEGLGIALDPARNAAVRGCEGELSTDGSPVRVLAIPTDEERFIARETFDAVRLMQTTGKER